ncbi:hypothetical protein RJ55_04371 [Drechmeria coniospora]|nr:hypothetical protein RJ55_04371 [Drechmeria coniospora]
MINVSHKAHGWPFVAAAVGQPARCIAIATLPSVPLSAQPLLSGAGVRSSREVGGCVWAKPPGFQTMLAPTLTMETVSFDDQPLPTSRDTFSTQGPSIDFDTEVRAQNFGGADESIFSLHFARQNQTSQLPCAAWSWPTWMDDVRGNRLFVLVHVLVPQIGPDVGRDDLVRGEGRQKTLLTYMGKQAYGAGVGTGRGMMMHAAACGKLVLDSSLTFPPLPSSHTPKQGSSICHVHAVRPADWPSDPEAARSGSLRSPLPRIFASPRTAPH